MKTSFKHLRRHSARGFTLMEMILVLAIIALLVGLGINAAQNVGLQAEITTTKANLNTMRMNLQRYKSMAGTLPSQAQGLEALSTRPSGNPAPRAWLKFTDESALLDAWQSKFQYRNPGKRNKTSFDVFSFGPDQQEGTEDDIYEN